MTYADNLKIYKAKCDWLLLITERYTERGFADDKEIVDYLNAWNELQITTAEYHQYFSRLVRAGTNLDSEV